jgi:cytochrome c-type biogenesis protein CcmH/NrfF
VSRRQGGGYRGARARAALVALLALALVSLPVAGAAAAASRTTLTEIESEVMCPVCGTLLELAESPQAQREKVFVEKLVREGKTKDQIKDALVAQYGDAVLALPKGSGFNLSAYVVPVIAFAVAAAALGFAVYKWRRASGSREDHDVAVETLSDEERERLDADLGRYDL